MTKASGYLKSGFLISGIKMSHFAVYVVVPKEDMLNMEDYIENILAPYWEELEVKPYISEKKEEIEAKFEEIKKQINETDLDKLPDYLRPYKREKDINKMSIKEFCKSWYGEEMDKAGNTLTTYNPNSKWDWFEIGGRFEKRFIENGIPSDKIQIKELIDTTTNKDFKNLVPFAFVNREGKWFEQGNMGWFGISSNEKDIWIDEFKELLLNENPEDYLIIVDCHI